MAMGSNYLHARPVSADLMRGFYELVGQIANYQGNTFNGRVVCALTRTALCMGVLTIPSVAFIEGVGALILAKIGAQMNTALYGGRSIFLERRVVQLNAYSLHSMLVGCILWSHLLIDPSQILFTVNRQVQGELVPTRRPLMSLKTFAAIVDQGLYLSAAVIALLFKKDQNENYRRALGARLHAIWSSRKEEIREDLSRQSRVDFGRENTSIVEFIERLLRQGEGILRGTAFQTVVDNFEFVRLLRDSEYRRGFFRQMGSAAIAFLQEMDIGHITENGRLVLQGLAETAYRQHLQGLFRTAIQQISRDATLQSYLDQGGNLGLDRLKAYDVFPELFNFTVYLELQESHTQCPATFSPSLRSLSGRKEKIEQASRLLADLSSAERQSLEKKLLGKEEALSEKARQCFQSIGELAAHLTQGPLMTEVSYGYDQADHLSEETRNLFQSAYQEEVAALEEEPASAQ